MKKINYSKQIKKPSFWKIKTDLNKSNSYITCVLTTNTDYL